MARIELSSTRPDGSRNWIDIRQAARPLDYVAAQESIRIVVEVAPDGTEIRHAVGGAEERMRFALLARAIEDWSFPATVPAKNHAKPEEVLDSVLTDPDDWDKACEAVQPLLDRVQRRPAPKPEETAQ